MLFHYRFADIYFTMPRAKLHHFTFALSLLALLFFNVCAASPLSEAGFHSPVRSAQLNFEEDNVCVRKDDRCITRAEEKEQAGAVQPTTSLSAFAALTVRTLSAVLATVCRPNYYLFLFLYYLF